MLPTSKQPAPPPSWPCVTCTPGSCTSTGSLTVVCLDLGADTGLAAFRQNFTGPGNAAGPSRFYDAEGVRTALTGHLQGDFDHGPVALGLEGPCWGEAERPLGPLVPRTSMFNDDEVFEVRGPLVLVQQRRRSGGAESGRHPRRATQRAWECREQDHL